MVVDEWDGVLGSSIGVGSRRGCPNGFSSWLNRVERKRNEFEGDLLVVKNETVVWCEET